MHLSYISLLSCALAAVASGSTLNKRDTSQFAQGEPIDASGKGGPILGGTNHQIDLQNPDNLGAESTDAGTVPNLKWSFSNSKTRIFNGGWTREQVITDIPASSDIAGAQQHLEKGAVRELHWHRVAEWGFVYAGEVLVSAVDENGDYQVDKLQVGDVWYFPKGSAHTVQGLADENEYLLAFDDGITEVPCKSRSRTKDGATARISESSTNYNSTTF